jgi:hypothetical protein
MPACVGGNRAREVLIEVQKHCARNVILPVAAPSSGRIREIETTIRDHPVLIVYALVHHLCD